MSKLGVGKEVLSYCNKCKLALAHIIVTMKTDTVIGKTQCKTCSSTHAYKDPSGVKASKTRSKTSVKKTASKKASVSDLWMEAIGKATKKSVKYSPKTKFEMGDLIDHPKFGPGVIERCFDGDKIQVLFRHEIKTLIHNK